MYSRIIFRNLMIIFYISILRASDRKLYLHQFIGFQYCPISYWNFKQLPPFWISFKGFLFIKDIFSSFVCIKLIWSQNILKKKTFNVCQYENCLVKHIQNSNLFFSFHCIDVSDWIYVWAKLQKLADC